MPAPKDRPVRITDVTLLPFDRDVVTEFSLDLPRAAGVLRGARGNPAGTLWLDVAGWAVGTRQRVLSVELTSAGQPLRLLPVSVERPDVVVRYREGPQGLVSGFVGQIGLLGLPPDFEIGVSAVVRGESRDERVRVPVAVVRGSRDALAPNESRFQPLMLTSLGRSGTTQTLRLLSQHPEIAAAQQHPYEVRPAVYWMHLLKVLGDPADHARSSVPDGFENVLTHVGPDPYAHPRYLDAFADPPSVRAAFGLGHLELARDYCARSIDLAYAAIAADQGHPEARYFAEKQLPSHVQWVFWEVYAQPREIILVRDFRDVVCSARAFNAKRAFAAFGREKAPSEEQWVRNMADRGVQRLVDAYRRRGDRAHRVRYEDVILRPAATLTDVFRYLDIDDSPATVARVLERADVDTAEARRHRTSDDPRASIARWRRDLEGPLRDIVNDAMGPALEAFGYEV